jgi:hypothetical protein
LCYLESAGIISSGIGTRSMMGIPEPTMASCFYLKELALYHQHCTVMLWLTMLDMD